MGRGRAGEEGALLPTLRSMVAVIAEPAEWSRSRRSEAGGAAVAVRTWCRCGGREMVSARVGGQSLAAENRRKGQNERQGGMRGEMRD
jgi:hypothetical protein